MGKANGAANLLAHVPLAWQHRPDVLGRNQRKKIARYVRLACAQGGLRCLGGYVVACHYCGWWMPLGRATIEHLVNRRDGGGNHPSNLVLACYSCNNARQKRESLAWQRYGLKKSVRRRLHLFRMDVGPPRILVIVNGDRLRLKSLRLTPAASEGA